MTPRRILAASAVLLAAAACGPKVDQSPSPASVVTALFDPLASELPLPNDLLLQQDPATLPVPPAQQELIAAFQAQKGFPNDQEVAITVGFGRSVIHADGSVTREAPALDLSSFGPSTFFVYGITAAGQGEVALDPIQAADYAAVADAKGTEGVLTLHRLGRQPWAPGQYLVLVRGGAAGVRTTAGEPVQPSTVFYLVAQGQDMTTPANLGILKAQTGSTAAALALAQQLNQLIQGYLPAFAVADTRFPHRELAVLSTFTIAPLVTQVELDPNRGLVPLPIDLLRDPRPASPTCAACGKLTPLAACTLAGGTLDAAGACSSAAAAGFAALDGFSTTAPLLAATSDLVQAATVTPQTLQLYELRSTGPVLVPPATYVTEPCEFGSSGLSPVIALQPAGGTSCDATALFRTRPLKDDTEYAVVVSDGVHDKTGKAIGPGTVARILLFDNPLVSATGASQLQGVDDATAGALEVMRQKLKPVLDAAAAGTPAVTKAHVAMAYTFKTQSFLGTASLLASLPYNPAAPLPTRVDVAAPLTAAEAFAKYGVDPSIPHANVQAVVEAQIVTSNLIDPATGAFHPNPADAVPETIDVLVAVPAVTGTPPLVAPLLVFRHGLGGGRADMLTVADSFAAQGMVTVAIDAAKHGDRAFCTSGAATFDLPGAGPVPQCAVGTCQAILPPGAQGDAVPMGLCTLGGGAPGSGFPQYRPVSASCFASPASCGWTGTEGIPVYSSNYVVSANFFRIRDTFRQDIIDESQLVRAVAVNPLAPPVDDALAAALGGLGVVVDPLKVYYAGQSLGALHGTMTVATNPRISKAVLNVGGGTIVDIFTTSPAFKDGIDALLAGMGITPGTSAYLQFLAVAKLVLDPADPVNYAGHLLADTLPDFTSATPAAQAPKKILTQEALCDQVVPNAWNDLWASNVGSAPLPPAPTFGAPGDFQLYFRMGAAPPTPSEIAAAVAACAVPGATSPNAVPHGFFTSWSDPLVTGAAQSAAAGFLSADTLPPSLVVLP